jgi:DNA-binding transcriptional regulator YbjK
VASENSTPSSEDARTKAIRATLSLIAAGGIAAAHDQNRLAQACGLGLAEFDELFPDRDQLLREALLFTVEEEIGRLGVLAAGMRRNPPSAEAAAAAIEGGLWATAERARQVAELELHLQAARDPGLREASRRAFVAYEDFAIAVLEALSLPASAENAATVIALLTGLAVRRLATDERDARGTKEALIALVRGFSSQPEA